MSKQCRYSQGTVTKTTKADKKEAMLLLPEESSGWRKKNVIYTMSDGKDLYPIKTSDAVLKAAFSHLFVHLGLGSVSTACCLGLAWVSNQVHRLSLIISLAWLSLDLEVSASVLLEADSVI